MSFECCHCKHMFVNKANLIAHQKKAVYCLEIQHKGTLSKMEIKESIGNFRCDDCGINFMAKIELTRHSKVCKSRDSPSIRISEPEMSLLLANKEIEMLREQNKELKEIIARERQNQQHVVLAAISKPTTTNSSVKNTVKNCIIQNLPRLTEADMREQIDNLTIDHVKAGAQGFANYAMQFPFKDKLTRSDVSRLKLIWRDTDDNVIHDTEGIKIMEKFFRISREKNTRLFREIINDLGDQYDSACNRQDDDERNAIVELTDKIATLKDQSKSTSRGENTELGREFVKHLCLASKP